MRENQAKKARQKIFSKSLHFHLFHARLQK
nr:MAG TPA_asm: hypothetical protein [Caudoviricetes sp.]